MSENHEHADVIFILNLRGTSNKNILGERGSDDKNVEEFVHFNVFERQTPSMHGNILVFISS